MRLLFIVAVIIPLCSMAQLTSAEKDLFKKYFPIDFPMIKIYGNTITDISDYNDKMLEFCNTHPPFPNISSESSGSVVSILDWENKWNNKYPVFIEYHKYINTRTLNDDIISYRKAKEYWKIKNPIAFSEFGSIINKIESPYFIPEVLPADFPQIDYKGNDSKTIEIYKRDINLWIKNHSNYQNISIIKNPTFINQ